MKLMKKTLALMLCLAMTLSFNVFAYSDVTENVNAIETLSALNILTGFEDGTFKPEDKVTRAQMAAIIGRALGYNYDAVAATGSVTFTDVPNDHWAIAYIEMAQSMGIINGYSAELFGPEDEVTYDQAIKMIVCALGYQKKAEAMVKEGQNPFPTAYNAIANQKKITNGVTVKGGSAIRSDIAQLVYNALTVNLMDQTSFGSDIEFQEVKNQSLLYTKLNALKVKAKIVSVPFDTTTNFVEIAVSEEDAIAKADGVNFAGIKRVKKGNVNLVNAQGLEVEAIIDYSDSTDPKLLAILPITKNSTELVIAADLIKGIEDNRVVYYKNANSNTVSKSVKIADNITVYFNAQTTNITTASNFQDYLNSGKTANDKSYKFIINNENVIDTIFIENAVSFVVGRINYYDFEIYRDNTNTFNSSITAYNDYVLQPLDLNIEDNENIAYDIYNTKGETLSFDDIKVGDILTVAQSIDNGITYYEIIVSTGDMVEGIITETRTEKIKNSNKEYTIYTIDGKDYIVNGYVKDASGLEAGVVGSFQLTANNEIIAYDLDKTIKNYGVVIATGAANSNFDKGNRVQIITADGVIKTYSFATKLYVDGVLVSTDSDTVVSEVKALEHEVIKYELNSSKEIKKVSTTISDLDVKYSAIAADSKYAAATGKIDGKYITDNTKIVAIPSPDKKTDKDAYSFVSVDSLTDEEVYTGYLVYDNDTKEVSFAFITNLITKPAFDSIPMVVTSKSVVSIDDSARTKITGYIENKEVSYVIAEDDEVTKFDKENKVISNASDIDVNDVIQFAINANDEIVAYRYLLDWNTETKQYDMVTSAIYNVDDDVYGCGIKGKAIKVASRYIELYVDDTTTIDAFYDANNVVYMFGNNYSKVKTTSFDALRTFDNYENVEIDTVIDDIVYIYSYDGKNIFNFIWDVKSDNK